MNKQSYRPIAFSSSGYKHLEKLLLNRIDANILQTVPVQQAPKKSTTYQVLPLTTFIGADYQRKIKTSVAFIDLSSAYETVWKDSLLYKFLKTLSCETFTRLLNNMLSDRQFRVSPGSLQSNSRKLNNEQSQESDLSSVSIYQTCLPPPHVNLDTLTPLPKSCRDLHR